MHLKTEEIQYSKLATDRNKKISCWTWRVWGTVHEARISHCLRSAHDEVTRSCHRGGWKSFRAKHISLVLLTSCHHCILQCFFWRSLKKEGGGRVLFFHYVWSEVFFLHRWFSKWFNESNSSRTVCVKVGKTTICHRDFVIIFCCFSLPTDLIVFCRFVETSHVANSACYCRDNVRSCCRICTTHRTSINYHIMCSFDCRDVSC